MDESLIPEHTVRSLTAVVARAFALRDAEGADAAVAWFAQTTGLDVAVEELDDWSELEPREVARFLTCPAENLGALVVSREALLRDANVRIRARSSPRWPAGRSASVSPRPASSVRGSTRGRGSPCSESTARSAKTIANGFGSSRGSSPGSFVEARHDADPGAQRAKGPKTPDRCEPPPPARSGILL